MLRCLVATLSERSRLPSVRHLLGLAVLFSCACGVRQQGGVRPHVEEPFPQKLSKWHLFVGKPSSLQPNKGVIPYDVNTSLFKDYAAKHRFVWMPAGTSAVYQATTTFQFPVGTIFSKTFSYPIAQTGGGVGKERLIETRLLVHAKSGWVGLPYVWNEDQTEAVLQVDPDPTLVSWTHPSGENYSIEYIIPNMNQCKNCHENSRVMGPLGSTVRNLNRDFAYSDGRANQLAYWTSIGYLKGAPTAAAAAGASTAQQGRRSQWDAWPKLAVWDDPATGSLQARAGAYLDVNCGNCHNPRGPANSSGLYLSAEVTDPLRLGVCKVPVSAGQGSGNRRFDIVPGKPDRSILVYRMESTTPKVMMPELGRSVAHKEGIALIREWVASMQGNCGAAQPRGHLTRGSVLDIP